MGVLESPRKVLDFLVSKKVGTLTIPRGMSTNTIIII